MKDLHKKIMVIIFFAIITIIPVMSLISMPRGENPRSEIENRELAAFPRFNTERLMSTEYMHGIEAWANDRVIGRENWIRLKNTTERLLGKLEINGVFVTDERMMQVWSGYNEENVNRTLNAMNRFALRHIDTPVYVILVPTSQEIYRDTLPESTPAASQKDFIRYCYDELTELISIDILPLLKEHSERYIYYRTDHHWTSLGAYIAYTAAGSVMGFTPLELSRFNIENANTAFRGTLHSRTLDDNVTPDIINIYTLTEDEPEVKVTINSGMSTTVYDSLYFREFLDTKNKYAMYLNDVQPLVGIKSEPPGIPERKLLIFKDSYAHCLIPFLAKNYSEITVADMRFINTGYDAFFNVDDYDAVLFIYNVITFSEDMNLVKLNAGR